jgi:histone deacetylase complex regulatory component SIN3
METRENTRRKQNQYFKPLNDMDFTKSERTTHSYVAMPKCYPKFCSGKTELTSEVLNTEVVSVPSGSEHVSFNIMRKN